MGMKSYWAIPFLATILILGTLVVQDVYAPPPQKPEKLSIESLSWDGKSQEFLIEYLVQFGIAKAGDNANFRIFTTLTIVDEGNSFTESAGDRIELEPLATSPDSPVAIQVHIPFDPIANGVEGPVKVTVQAVILTPAENPEDEFAVPTVPSATEDFYSEIIEEHSCDDGIDNDEDGLIDSDDPDCVDED